MDKKKDNRIRIRRTAVLLLACSLLAGCAKPSQGGPETLTEPVASESFSERDTSEHTSSFVDTEEDTSGKEFSTEDRSEETSGETNSSEEEHPAEPVLLTGEDWAADVRQGLNDFLLRHSGKKGEKTYVVFDFDNTCSIFDTQVELFLYQTEQMAYAVTPEELKAALLANLKKADQPDESGCSERDWIEDIIVAYGALWDTYGPFTPEGLSEEKQAELQKDPYYREFFVKMRALYSKVSSTEGAETSCFWLHSTFTGMTREEVYRLAVKCFQTHSQMDSSYVTEYSPDPSILPSRVGQKSVSVTRGIYVTENIRELMGALKAADVEIYVCSASMDLTILAAVDSFGLREYVTAVLGVTSRTTGSGGSAVLTSYPAENGGYAWYPAEGNETFSWSEGTLPLTAMPQGPGKVTAIENAVLPLYGHGPAAGFMDSSGDFNFCTEFASLELVVCFNRGWRYVTDGGGLVAEAALLQASRGETLQSASEKGDTLYLLQGRDETGRGRLIADHGSVHLIPDQEAVYRILENDSNEQMLQYMKDHSLRIAEVFDRFCLRTEAGGDNPFSFRYGFLESYAGYHSR